MVSSVPLMMTVFIVLMSLLRIKNSLTRVRSLSASAIVCRGVWFANGELAVGDRVPKMPLSCGHVATGGTSTMAWPRRRSVKISHRRKLLIMCFS